MKNRLKAILLSGAVLATSLTQMTSPSFAQTVNPFVSVNVAVPPQQANETRVYDYHSTRLLLELREYIRRSNLDQAQQTFNLADIEKFVFQNLIKSDNLYGMMNTNTKITNANTQNNVIESKKISINTNDTKLAVQKILDELIKFFNKPGGMGAALTGKNKPIPLFDNPIDKVAREPVPNFDTLADDMRTKNTPPVTAYTPAMSQAITRYKLQDTIKFQPTLDPKNSLYVTRERRSHVASSAVTAFAVSEGAFKQSSKSMERINTYIQAIKDSPDIKTSVDLNTRVMLEIVQQNNELLRSIAAMNSVNANYMMFNLGGK